MSVIRFSFLFLIVFIGSCNSKTFDNSDRMIARAYDSYLYLSDLEGLVPEGTSTIDSLSITQSYINNWVKNQLLLYQAEKNLTDDQKDFTRQLQDYRNSLIIYEYESELIRQNLDTVVPFSEIEEYYNANRNNFELRENILQLVYVKIRKGSPRLEKIKTLAWSNEEQDRDSLEYYCMRFAEDYAIIDHDWITFVELLEMVPLDLEPVDASDFLKNKTHAEARDKHFLYYLHLLDYRLIDSIAPLAMERDNIRAIILNKRKKQLIKKMQQEIYDRAMQENDFEYY